MQFKGLAASIELEEVLDEAREIARESDAEQNSSHLLLALFTVANRAKTVLADRGLELDTLIDVVLGLDPEPVDTVSVVHHKTARITESCGSRVVGTLHLLAGLCRVSMSQAYRALQQLGVSPAELRNTVISHLTGGMPRKYLRPSAAPHADRVETRGGEGLSEHVPELDGAAVLATPSPVATPVAVAQAVYQPAVLPEPSDLPPNLDDEEIPSNQSNEQFERSRFELDPEAFPMLTTLGRNLTQLAEADRLDPLIGRGREVEQLVDVLNKRRSNNPCLVGDPGVGKTAVVEGLAQRIVHRDSQVGALGEKILVELQMGSLVAGTQLRGAFSERLGALKDEVQRLSGRVILFIDEIHTLIGAGAGEGALDAANDLKTALARGDFPCIGATTEKEYRRYIESDPALERRFQVVLVDEPSHEDAIEVLHGLQVQYSEHHRVRFRKEAIEACVRLSSRWIADRFLPGKAIDVLDLAGAYASRHGKKYVGEEEVARVVAQKAAVPEERLVGSDTERLLSMESHLKERIVSHESAIVRVARVVRRNFAGFTSNRPTGSFLILGPTGVGKTECARVLAEFLFGSRDALTRIDMSEYMDAHSVSRLIGAPPGYVGHEDGGQLTESVRRRPYQVLLFDEVEKASADVLNLLLQLLEEGQLTDGRGRRVHFQNTLVLMTSNLGQEHFDPAANRRVGFAAVKTVDDRADQVRETARKAFTPELWNRFDETLVFHPLSREDVIRVAGLLLEQSSDRLKRERKIAYEVRDDVIPLLIERGGFEPKNGARPMRRTIEDLVEGPVAEAILSGNVAPESTLTLGVVDGEIVLVS